MRGEGNAGLERESKREKKKLQKVQLRREKCFGRERDVFSSASDPSRAEPRQPSHLLAGPTGHLSISEWNVRATSADDLARTNH